MALDDVLKVRISEDLKSDLEDQADRAGISVSELVRGFLREGEVEVTKPPEIPEVNREAFRHVTKGLANLNQLAKNANSARPTQVPPDLLEDVKSILSEIQDDLRKGWEER